MSQGIAFVCSTSRMFLRSPVISHMNANGFYNGKRDGRHGLKKVSAMIRWPFFRSSGVQWSLSRVA